MQLPISLYSGCGNTFIFIDGRAPVPFTLSCDAIVKLCSKEEGFGVDGLAIVGHSKKADVSWKFFNSDGNEAEMCGNGARCLLSFLQQKRHFPTRECLLEAKERLISIAQTENSYKVQMGPCSDLQWDITLPFQNRDWKFHYLNTGVPHLVTVVPSVDKIDVKTVGSYFRHHPSFSPKGANVNFVELSDPYSLIRTYERGVENETLACGTGATACGYVLAKRYAKKAPIALQVRSKDFLHIHLLDDILYLEGPTQWLRDDIAVIDQSHVKL